MPSRPVLLRQSHRSATIFVAGLVLLSACSGDELVMADHEGARSPSTHASPTASRAGAGTEPPTEASSGTVEPGVWALYAPETEHPGESPEESAGEADSGATEGDPATERLGVRLDAAECGISDFAERDGFGFRDPDRPLYADPSALPGMEFCVFTLALRNDGETPVALPAPGGAVLGDEVALPTNADRELSVEMTVARTGTGLETLAPGQQGQILHVVSVPEGSVVSAMEFPEGDPAFRLRVG